MPKPKKPAKAWMTVKTHNAIVRDLNERIDYLDTTLQYARELLGLGHGGEAKGLIEKIKELKRHGKI